MTACQACAWVAAMVFLAACKPADDAPGGPRGGRSARDGQGSSSAHRASASTNTGRPNVVLVVVCSFRYSHIGAAGYPRNTTPFLDSMAERGAFFENMVSASSWTKPAMASLLTGLTPNVHQLTEYYSWADIVHRRIVPKHVLADENVTLAECLRDAGYATMCRVNNLQAGEFFKLDQGFDDAVTADALTTRQMAADLAAWLDALGDKRPFFCMLMTRDAHFPYMPEHEYFEQFNRSAPVTAKELEALANRMYEMFKSMHPPPSTPEAYKKIWIDLYDAELAQLDAALSEIPEVLLHAGCLDDTLLVVTADHGEHFFEHGRVGHSHSLEETVIKVPLIVAGSGVRPGRRYPAVARSIDLYPTIADLAQAAKPPMLQGRSLAPLLLGETDRLPPVTAFASSLYKGTYHMVRRGTYKLHQGRRGLGVFDLERDPGEERNLLRAEPTLAAELSDLLAVWLEQEKTLREMMAEDDTRELTPEVIEQLRGLGYME